MKKNIVSLVLLVVLGGVAAYFYFTKSGSTFKPELTDYAYKDTTNITKIFLADKKGNKILLERENSHKWKVNKEFRARQDGVNNLLDVIARVEVKAPINKAAYEAVVKRIASSGIKVEIYTDSDEPTKVIYVGGSNQEHTGTEMLIEGSSTPHLTHIPGFYGFLVPRFFTNINEWKDRSIFKYEYGQIAKVKVEYPLDPKESFEITDLGNDQFALTDLTNGVDLPDYDTLLLLDYVSRFKNIPYESFEETKTEDFITNITQSKPETIFTVTDKLGNSVVCKTHLKPAHEGATDLEGNPILYDLDRLYAFVNDKDFVVVQHFVFDNLERKLTDFQPK